MIRKRLVKMMACVSLATMFMSYDVASAAFISSTLSSDATTVTTVFNSGTSGKHDVTVKGYERHTQLTQYCHLYSESNTFSGGGTFSTNHSSHEGFEFLKIYDNTRLTSFLYLNGSLIGEIITT